MKTLIIFFILVLVAIALLWLMLTCAVGYLETKFREQEEDNEVG